MAQQPPPTPRATAAAPAAPPAPWTCRDTAAKRSNPRTPSRPCWVTAREGVGPVVGLPPRTRSGHVRAACFATVRCSWSRVSSTRASCSARRASSSWRSCVGRRLARGCVGRLPRSTGPAIPATGVVELACAAESRCVGGASVVGFGSEQGTARKGLTPRTAPHL